MPAPRETSPFAALHRAMREYTLPLRQSLPNTPAQTRKAHHGGLAPTRTLCGPHEAQGWVEALPLLAHIILVINAIKSCSRCGAGLGENDPFPFFHHSKKATEELRVVQQLEGSRTEADSGRRYLLERRLLHAGKAL